MNFYDVTPTLTPSSYAPSDAMAGAYGTDMIVVVTLRGSRNRRFGLGFVAADGHCRRVTGGPILLGPYAYAYGLATCIAADPRMGTGAEMRDARDAGLVIDADLGDVLILQGSLWRIDPDHNDNIKLTEMKIVPAVRVPMPAHLAATTPYPFKES